ncbi:unnamed protein product, partial [Onchocerca ochengi]|uniref:RNase H domain-containing protein n=1 Tax=Onchocerca ochengi TaxID=42157 RepID=A0A182EW64_ONCOC
IFLQTPRKENNSWDQLLGEEDELTWRNLINDWTEKVTDIPRLTIQVTESSQIHVFTDASTLAYSAAVYAKQGTETFSIFAKSRIASIKGTTIPRLELLAILIGVRAAQFVSKQLDLEPVQVTLWSDSKCALHWIRNHSRLQPTFIQNQVEEIRNANFSFRYIPRDESDWPLWELNFKENDEEVNVIGKALKSTIARETRRLLDASCFSKWTKLVRTTIWILKFINLITKGRIPWLQSLSKEEGEFPAADY